MRYILQFNVRGGGSQNKQWNDFNDLFLELHKILRSCEEDKERERALTGRKNSDGHWLSYFHLNIYKIVVWTNYWFSPSAAASWTFNSIRSICWFSLSLNFFAYTGLWGGVISSAPSPEPGSPFVLFSFFHFMRRFWNLCRGGRELPLIDRQFAPRRVSWITYHILIWRSVRQSACAISMRLRRVK